MSNDRIGILKSSQIIIRHPSNPILTSKDLPYKSDLVFNAGVPKYEGKYVMIFRNDVIFPDGMILEKDGQVKIYYGAADTVECLATAHVDDLIPLCVSNNGIV